MFSLMCARINDCVNDRNAADKSALVQWGINQHWSRKGFGTQQLPRHCGRGTRSGNNPYRGTSTDRGTPPDRGTLHLDRRRLIRIKVASGKHLFLWYNSNCDWQRCIGITMIVLAISITPVTPFQFMGLSLTTRQSGCPFQKEWKPYISSHVSNVMATSDDKQYFQLTANFVI